MGSQTPSVRVIPEYAYTDGEDAAKILAASKLYVDPWQANVLNDWMGRTDDDVWTAPTCGLSVPRQNGKTLNTSGRITSGMVMYFCASVTAVPLISIAYPHVNWPKIIAK